MPHWKVGRFGEHNLLLFKKYSNFKWTLEFQEAFEGLKVYLQSLKVLSQLRKCKNLFLYLDVADLTISILLLREEGKIQHPVYYFSMMLQDAKTRYLKMENVSLALISASRKLKPYLQAHQVIVLTYQPFR